MFTRRRALLCLLPLLACSVALPRIADARDFASDNAGKIVFSKSPIKPGSENPAAMTNTFSASDPIYAVIYTKPALKDITWRDGVFEIQLEYTQNGSSFAPTFEAAIGPAERARPNSHYLYLDVLPAPGKAIYPEVAGAMAKMIARVPPGTQTVKLRVRAVEGNSNYALLAEGSFSLQGGGNAAKKAAAADDRAMAAKARMPKAAMRNANLEKSILAATKRHDPATKPLRAVLTERGWTVTRDSDTGAILYRGIKAAVASRYGDGTIMVEDLMFAQEYLGGGRYAKNIELKGVGMRRAYQILPANVPK